MIKNSLIWNSLIISMALIVGCDSWNVEIVVKQSINNLSSDTIVVVDSGNEFRGISVKNTITCFPFSETLFFDAVLNKQPLEPYDMPYISQNATVYTSSKRILTKNIHDEKNWRFNKTRKQEYLKFTINEEDLE